MPAAFAAASCVLMAVFVSAAGSGTAGSSAMLAASVLALVAVAAGLRIHHVPDRRPWWLVSVGLGLLTVVNLLSWMGAAAWPVAPFQIGGYLALLAASLFIVWRRAPHDRGGIIDAAVVGIATGAPVWEFVLRPALTAGGMTAAGQVAVLTQMLVLLGILGALLRITHASRRRDVTVWLLFGALCCAVAGDVVTTITGGTDGSGTWLSGLLYLGGYLSVGAAALHPSIGALTHPVTDQPLSVPKLRLGLFGAALVVVPVVGGLPQLFGEPPDGLLLTLGPLVMVPLVLIRAGQLTAQRARDQRDLAYQANHDELTGLVNRRRLFAVVAQAMAADKGSHRFPVAVLYCDLDDFKPINDRYGHEAGDEVLRQVGRRLAAVLRDGDVAARIGGDEFLAYCPGVDETFAIALRQRIEEALHEPITWNGMTLRVGATVGVSLSEPGAYSSPDELIATADAAMYMRKRRRKAADADRRSSV